MTISGETAHPENKEVLLIGPPAHDTINIVADDHIQDGQLVFDLGGKVVVESREMLGGNIFNTARHLARWGVKTTFAWNMGKYCDMAVDVLTEFPNVDTSMVGRDGSIGQSTIFVTESGQNDRVVIREGFATPLDSASQQTILGSLDRFSIVHASSLDDNQFLRDLVDEGNAKDIVMSLSPTRTELAETRKLRRIMQGIHFFACNKEEAMQVVPEALDALDNEDPQTQLRALSLAAHHLMVLRDDTRYAVAVISDGRNGLVAVDNTSIVTSGLYPEARQRPRVSSLGTGDAMTSGALYKSFVLGADLQTSVHFANAAATHVLGDFGASESSFPLIAKLRKMPIDVTTR